MTTLAEIRSEADGQAYPCALLERCRTALVLFAAGFKGRQDAYWIAEAGLEATCIDIRPENLAVMADIYPGDWKFVQAEAVAYSQEAARAADAWDLVSIDCPSGMFDACAELIDLWCALAHVAIVLGTGRDTQIVAPAGWTITDVRRRSSFAGGVYWTVLEHAC